MSLLQSKISEMSDIDILLTTYEYMLQVHFNTYEDIYTPHEIQSLFHTIMSFEDKKDKLVFIYKCIKKLLNNSATQGMLIELQHKYIFMFPDNKEPYLISFEKFVLDNPDQKDNWVDGGFFMNLLNIN